MTMWRIRGCRSLSPYFLFYFSCFYAYSKLSQVKLRLCLPRRVRKEVQLGPRRVLVPRGQNCKKSKNQNKGEGGVIVLKEQKAGLSKKLLSLDICDGLAYLVQLFKSSILSIFIVVSTIACMQTFYTYTQGVRFHKKNTFQLSFI